MRIVAYVPDLMDRSRFSALDAEVTFVRQPSDLAGASEGADVAIVDLGRPGALDAVAGLTVLRRMGFVSHENREVFEAAAALGVEAMPRSRFLTRIEQIVHKQSGE